MRILRILIISLVYIFLVINCTSQNVFTEKDNIIELNATKLKDDIQFNKIDMPLIKKNEWNLGNIFPDIIGIPDSLNDIETYYFYVNFDQALLQAFNAKLIGKDDFEQNFQKTNLGTTECINQYVKTFVVVVTGKSENDEKYYIIDSNNDFNLSNDIPFRINSSQNTSHTHNIEFERVINNEIKKDSTWISLSFLNNKVFFRFDEYTSTNFKLNNITYEIRVFPSKGPIVNYGSQCFFEILNKTNYTIQMCNFNEFIKLDNSNFKITCREDGLKIKLLKENISKNSESTQTGLPPFSFNALNLKGDSVNFPDDFKNKIILLDFWATYCGPCIHDIKTSYMDLYERYGNNKFEIIGVANNSQKELFKFTDDNKINWIIIADGEGKKIQKLYNIYQLPTLFLISKEGIIIAKEDEIRGNKLESLLNKLIESK